MDFVLALHGHLPYVLHHGRWPHGSVWLSEAALDTYLPLIDVLLAFERDAVPAPVTLGITPVLANQLADPAFVAEFEEYMATRLAGCASARAALAASGDADLVPVAGFWAERLTKLLGVFRSLDGDLIGALRGLEQRGRIELISSAATHGFLPLLGRDESIRLQLLLGAAEHERLFGRAPQGCWLPECAFRPAGPWRPAGATPQARRPGIDEHLRFAGFRYFFVDTHAVGAPAIGYPPYEPVTPAAAAAAGERSPYLSYRVPGRGDLFALVRDPASSGQVWSRHQGYPGDEWYLEFHKIRWPDGLRLWRVTGADADLGSKRGYEPAAAQARVRAHAAHFTDLLHRTARARAAQGNGVVVAPFDAELFGHWWFEGVDFVGRVYRQLAGDGIRPVTAREHVGSGAPHPAVQVAESSWGKDGDFSMWLNERTSWTWQRLWELEEQYWAAAPAALRGGDDRRAVLAQATRSLLLAQSSDWQFIMSTGSAADYADQRFMEHAADAAELIAGLAPARAVDAAMRRRVETLRAKDDLFPDVLATVERAII
jgi:1,4-alpha-glucan branching enzyme